MPTNTKRSQARVKLKLAQAEEIARTLSNALRFCQLNGSSEELTSDIRLCERDIKHSITHRNRVVGLKIQSLEGSNG